MQITLISTLIKITRKDCMLKKNFLRHYGFSLFFFWLYLFFSNSQFLIFFNSWFYFFSGWLENTTTALDGQILQKFFRDDKTGTK
jgi:hypothetical protein